jgi:hypothetical protein
MAHGLLIEWHTRAYSDGMLTYRYLLAAAYHANQAMILTSGAPFPLALSFIGREFQMAMDQMPELSVHLHYQALHEQLQKQKGEIPSVQVKREKKANKKVCAAPTCMVQAEAHFSLSQCTWRAIYLPHYLSMWRLFLLRFRALRCRQEAPLL